MPSLFPYQVDGSRWLSTQTKALLADEMGLGKSAQLITACDILKAQKILVLCPAVARINWQREFVKFSPNFRTSYVVESRKKTIPLSNIIICSYDLADHIPKYWKWDVLILDECHFLKSLETKRTRLVYGKEGLVHRTKRVWAVSGTPAPNHPGELWIMLYMYGQTKLSYPNYVKHFCTYYKTSYGINITGARESSIPELKKILNTFMLRRRKKDVAKELPPISFERIVVPTGEVDLDIQSSFVQYVFPHDRRHELADKLRHENDLLHTIIKQTRTGNEGLGAIQAMYNSISTLRRYTGLQKVQAVIEMVTEELKAKAYKKVVIFAIHRDVIESLRVGLIKYSPVTLYGGTDPQKRQKNVDKFQGKAKYKIFIGNIQAAGTAITLTAAHHVIFIEQDWVPGNNAQAAMRCHRIGQVHHVSVRFVGLADSLDERISLILAHKAKLLTQLFDDPENDRGELYF
jgi:SWI/SNF-related matrix-associated actin-dependent regulator 1 of chromatin subfamily A